MQEIQLYVKDVSNVLQRVELFDEDSISITKSIKNARDISKVFTTFSKQFSVPASKQNNKIFKHYYNSSIQSGFDARKKADARLEVNHILFTKGKVKLEGVDMRNNKPYAYRITFYGSVVELKDLLGEDKLPSLTVGTGNLDIDMPYSASSILTNIKRQHSLNHSSIEQVGISIPLITHSQRLYYNSARSSKQSGNMYYDGTVQGIKYDELKYAVRLDKILGAIEAKYTTANGYASNIEFAAGSFFDPNSATDITKLYMWCHRKKGAVDISKDQVLNSVEGFNPSGNFSSYVIDVVTDTEDNKIVINPTGGCTINSIGFYTTTSNTNAPYDVIIYRDTGSGFELLQEQIGIFGSKQIAITGNLTTGYKYTAYVRTYEESITFSELKWTASSSCGTDNFAVTSKTYQYSFAFNIAEQLPEMKIIDFLSALFQMFNLIAYTDDFGKIQVEPLEDFYGTTQRDISQYVDVSESQVDVPIPFKEIFFKYKDTKTILAQQHLQEISDPPMEWGGVEYNANSSDLSGDIFKLEPNFHHAKYEKIFDAANNIEDTGVQVGYFVTDNEESYLGSPLICYINNQATNNAIGFLSRTGVTQIASSTAVNMPSNLEDIDTATSANIHFGVEKSEYDAQPNTTAADATNTLFLRYYQSYIANVFNQGTRLVKVRADLPVGLLTQIDLGDVIIVGDRKYRINSMSSNLKDGKTSFELINYYD